MSLVTGIPAWHAMRAATSDASTSTSSTCTSLEASIVSRGISPGVSANRLSRSHTTARSPVCSLTSTNARRWRTGRRISSVVSTPRSSSALHSPSTSSSSPVVPRSAARSPNDAQVATTLATCASFGFRAALLGTTGDDDEVDGLCKALDDRGVDTTLLIRPPVRHRRALVLLSEQTGDRAVLWERDTRLALTPGEITRETIEASRLVHVDDVDVEASLVAARIACQAGIPVTSDIDQITDLTRELIATVTVPIFAEHVPRALTGEADPERALRALRKTHSGRLCVTLGSRGSMLLDGDQLHSVPAPTVRAVDATG